MAGAPNEGGFWDWGNLDPAVIAAAGAAAGGAGHWDAERGLRVALHREPGLTKKGLLRRPFRFQCSPLEEFARQGSYAHTDYDTIRAGQHSRPQGPQLRTVQFRTLFVDYDPSWATWHYHGRVPPGPWQEVEHVRDAGTPLRLIVAQPQLYGGAWTLLATLRDVTVTENAGEVGTRYIDLSFTEWRHLTVKTGRRPGPGSAKRDADPKPGDTLVELAKRYLKSAKRWEMIARANRITKVSPHSSEQLEAWMKKHGKKVLQIPATPKPKRGKKPRRRGVSGGTRAP